MFHKNGVVITIILLFLTVVLPLVHGLGTYMAHGYLTNQFRAKTAFFWTHPWQTLLDNDLMNATMNNRVCKAVHANLVSRHAARYPSVSNLRNITKFHEKIKAAYQNHSYSFIDTWNNTFPAEKADNISELGSYEMEYLGEMYGSRLGDLFKAGFSSTGFTDRLQFGATSKARTQTSAKLFSDSFSSSVMFAFYTLDRVPIRDQELRFFKDCNAYDQTASDKQEMVRFENGPLFQKVINNIAEKLQLNTTLTIEGRELISSTANRADDVKTLYLLCATELAINNNTDWCTLLSSEDLDVLQYDSDIEANIDMGYGSPITGQMSCPLASDIFKTLDGVIQDRQRGHQNYTLGVFQFGHLGTVLDLFTGLGLYKDHLPITANNFEQLKHRKFNTANIGSFSTHLVFILYECGGTSNSDYAVKLLVNGEPVTIPGFHSDVVKYQDVRQHYRHLVEGCDRQKLCKDGTVPQVIVG